MKDRRKVWRLNYIPKYINALLSCIALLTAINLYVLQKKATGPWKFLGWDINFIHLQVVFMIVVFVVLLSIVLLLHRSLGPIPRMEEELEKILKGERSLRLAIRKKDIIHGLVNHINRLLDMLEDKERGKA